MLTPEQDADQQRITDEFHALYYNGFETTWEQTYWKGVKVLKCPLDLWVYQEILWEQKPDFIIETGTAHGGSALWFADMCDLLHHGQVITIDIAGTDFFPDRPWHPRIDYITGSSIDEDVFHRVYRNVRGFKCLIVLDAAHDKDHVAAELGRWAKLTTPGGSLIVEDTNIHGHPVLPEHVPGPWEAVEEFLAANPTFERDTAREKFRLTFNPGGYLRRKA